MDFLADPFFWRTVAAGAGVALIAGPLGCFVLWRRMAYFGDTVAHAALLGVALALVTEIDVVAGVLAVALVVALTVAGGSGRRYAPDTLLGVLAHGGLAAGVVALAFLPAERGDLEAWLFGDILAVSDSELAFIWAAAALAGTALVLCWRPFLNSTINEELAAAEGGRPRRDRMLLLLGLALLVAAGLRVVGALLVTAMLILPAAAARPLARTPEAMAALAGTAGLLAVLLGLAAAWSFDSPAGPSVVLAALGLFILANLLRRA